MCGLCLPHCPTYRLTQDENESPRGRISLMRAVAAGELDASAALGAHIGRCLSCRACERVCPSGVRYGRLLAAGRAVLRDRRPARGWRHALTALGLMVATRAPLRRFAGRLLRLFRRSGGARLARATALRRSRLLLLEAAVPPLSPAHAWKPDYPAAGPSRGRVALFLGCVAREIDAATIDAAIRTLTRLGFDVAVPPTQTCCGALHRDGGDCARADELLAQNAAAFASGGSGTLLTLVSGCGAALADATAGPGPQLTVTVRDISEFLATVELPAAVELAPLAFDVAVQDPCTLRNVLRAEHGVYRLLERIPGIRLTALAENQLCCGGAGAYPLREPQLAERLRAAKLDHLVQLQPDLLVSANLGCALHLRAGLAGRGRSIEIVHPIVLFERQLRLRSLANTENG